jgi:archaellum component FlaF (FlaF/FlaG flagellin family)
MISLTIAIIIIAIIVVTGTTSYLLYWYNYHEAREAMSLVMPDMIYYLNTHINIECKQ